MESTNEVDQVRVLAPPELLIDEFLEFELNFELSAHFKCRMSELHVLSKSNVSEFASGLKHVLDHVVSPPCRQHAMWKLHCVRERKRAFG